MKFKLTINDPKTGKSYKREVEDSAADTLNKMRIGDKVKGEFLEMTGYEFEITGGTDSCGFPMRKDVDTPRKKILAVSGVGVKRVGKGMRQRKTVCGNRVGDKITLVNLKILKYGKSKLETSEKTPEKTVEETANKAPEKPEVKPKGDTGNQKEVPKKESKPQTEDTKKAETKE